MSDDVIWETVFSRASQRCNAIFVGRGRSVNDAGTISSREEALRSLGRLPFSYRALQAMYTSQVHMPDYRVFSETWNDTLYRPIRKEIQALVDLLTPNGPAALLYCAPGPHAPLLKPDRDVDLAARFTTVTLLDIDPEALQSAAESLQTYADIKVNLTELDFTGPFGQRLCDVYLNALSGAEQVSQITERLIDATLCIESIFHDAASVVSRMSEDTVFPAEASYPIVVSEMVASFTGTAVLLAFRSALYAMFAGAGAAVDLRLCMSAATTLWQIYNAAFLDVHLDFLKEQGAPNGAIAIILDTRKVYDDQRLNAVSAFHPSFSFPELLARRKLTIYRHAVLTWRDHRYSLEVTLHGESVPDFLAHTHDVQLFALKAAD